MTSQISHYVIDPFDILYRQKNLSLLHPFHQARLISIITFQCFSFYRWEIMILGSICSLCGLSQSTKAHHATRFLAPFTHSSFILSFFLILGFLPWVFFFYYTSVTLFSSLSQIPWCPFNTCPSRCSNSPVFIMLCCIHTIPVVASHSFTPHPLTHT